jgi:predicted transcriptional regulator
MSITITDAELALMRVLWNESPLNARQITVRLAGEKDWHRKTINTFLSRLENKGAISVKRGDDGLKQYTPRLNEATYNQSVTSQFVDQVFGGRVAPLIACFAKDGRLSNAQIDELRTLLEELSDDGD